MRRAIAKGSAIAVGVILIVAAIAGVYFLVSQGSAVSTTTSTTSSTAQLTTTAPLATVKVSYLPLITMTPLFIAIDKGFFNQSNLNVQLTNINLYTAMPLLSKAQFDFGIGADAATQWNAIGSGFDFKVVGSRLQYLNTSEGAFVVTKATWDSGIQTFAQLKGTAIGVPFGPGSLTDWYVSVLDKQNSMTKSDFTSVAVLDQPSLVAALKSGSITAAELNEPIMTASNSTGGFKIIPGTFLHQVIPGSNGDLLYSGNFIRTNHDAGVRFMKAWLMGVRYYNDPANRASVIAIAAKWTGVNSSVISTIYDNKVSWVYIPNNGAIDPTDAVASWQYFYDTGTVTKPPLPVSQWYDTSFINAANAALASSK